jgi:hypothetical protein|tara:strand:+ start:267 stop:1640 length:1374 start_codon:yes stop_codon:yes gene_type:complete
MIGETIVTAPRISTDIEVEPVQIDTSFQDISSELAELEKQVKELQQRRQNLIGQSQRGLGRFAPPGLFSTSDPDFMGGQQIFLKDLDKLIQPRLDRIEALKKLQKTKIDEAGISPAPIGPFNVTQNDLDELKTTKTGTQGDDTSNIVTTGGEDTKDDDTGAGDSDGTTTDIEDREPLFQTERMLNFLRNVGQSLVLQPDMGAGLAVGAAKAAEEQKKIDLLREQQTVDLLKESIKAGQKAQPSGSLIKQYQDDYLTNYSQFKKTETTLDWLNQVKTLINEPDNVTGLYAFAKSLGYQYFLAPFDAAATPDKLTIIRRILTTIATSNPGDIINQSSGRLSDRDIQLAQDILSSLKGFKAITQGEPELLKNINRQIIRFGEGQDERLAILNNANEFFKNNNLNPPPVPEFTAKQGSKTSTGQEVIEYTLGSLEAQNEITNKNIADKTRSEALKSAGVDD